MNPYSPPGALPDAYAIASPPYATVHADDVGEGAVEMLRQTRPWVVLLSVFAFAGSALMVMVALLAAGFAMLAPGAKGAPAALALMYLPLAAVYVYPGIKLWSYGTAISRLTVSRSKADLEDALGQQKSFWKFSGIASVVVVVLYAVGFAVLLAVGALTAVGMGKLGQ